MSGKPFSAQQTLRELRRQCLVAEPGRASSSGAESAPSSAASAPTQAEIVLWKTIEHSETPQDYEAYLKQYPNGAFTALANAHLQQLATKAISPAPQENLVNSRWTGLRQFQKKNGDPSVAGKIELTFDDESNCTANLAGTVSACTWTQSGGEIQISMPETKNFCGVELNAVVDGNKMKGLFNQGSGCAFLHHCGCDKTQGEWRMVRRSSNP
jgi:hypothetical protein